MRKTIQIHIDIKNHDEIVKYHKGQLFQFISNLMISKEKLKNTIEAKVYEEVMTRLQEEIPKKLLEEYVDANVSIEIISEDKSNSIY